MEPLPPQIPRSSKNARPWNEYHVVLAGQTYGVRGFKSMKDVQSYENTLVSKKYLDPEDRISCEAPGCMTSRKEKMHNHGEQGLLF
jgi:hypothetical protein